MYIFWAIFLPRVDDHFIFEKPPFFQEFKRRRYMSLYRKGFGMTIALYFFFPTSFIYVYKLAHRFAIFLPHYYWRVDDHFIFEKPPFFQELKRRRYMSLYRKGSGWPLHSIFFSLHRLYASINWLTVLPYLVTDMILALLHKSCRSH